MSEVNILRKWELKILWKIPFEDVCTAKKRPCPWHLAALCEDNQEGTLHGSPVAFLISWCSSQDHMWHCKVKVWCWGRARQALLRPAFTVWCWKSFILCNLCLGNKCHTLSPHKGLWKGSNGIIDVGWLAQWQTHNMFPTNELCPYCHCHCVPASICSPFFPLLKWEPLVVVALPHMAVYCARTLILFLWNWLVQG